MTEQTESKKIIAYKGFDENWKCRDYQYKVGETHEHKGDVEVCESGFHACEYPLDVFSYYEPSSSKFAVVEMSDEISRQDGGDSEIAAAKIHIKAEIKIHELVQNAVDWIKAKIDWSNNFTSNTSKCSVATNTSKCSVATNTGYHSVAINTGDQSVSTNTGYRSTAINTGYQSVVTNAGNCSVAINTGNWSAATNTGDQSASTNTGDRSVAVNTGDQSAAVNTGDWSAAVAEGEHSAATNTGDRSASTSTGNCSAATNTGYQSSAVVEGERSVAIAVGKNSKAKASKNGAIVCVYRKGNGDLVHIKSSKVGENGIKPDVFYTLDSNGEFVEVEE